MRIQGWDVRISLFVWANFTIFGKCHSDQKVTQCRVKISPKKPPEIFTENVNFAKCPQIAGLWEVSRRELRYPGIRRGTSLKKIKLNDRKFGPFWTHNTPLNPTFFYPP